VPPVRRSAKSDGESAQARAPSHCMVRCETERRGHDGPDEIGTSCASSALASRECNDGAAAGDEPLTTMSTASGDHPGDRSKETRVVQSRQMVRSHLRTLDRAARNASRCDIPRTKCEPRRGASAVARGPAYLACAGGLLLAQLSRDSFGAGSSMSSPAGHRSRSFRINPCSR
jgi:hypothetical protein